MIDPDDEASALAAEASAHDGGTSADQEGDEIGEMDLEEGDGAGG